MSDKSWTLRPHYRVRNASPFGLRRHINSIDYGPRSAAGHALTDRDTRDQRTLMGPRVGELIGPTLRTAATLIPVMTELGRSPEAINVQEHTRPNRTVLGRHTIYTPRIPD